MVAGSTPAVCAILARNNSIKFTNLIQSLLILIIYLIAPYSVAATFSKATIDLEISAFSLKETALLSRGTSTNIDGHFGLEIDSDLKINLWPVASFSSGQQASRDALNPLTNIIYLKEASVEKTAFNEMKIKIGALYQKEFLPGIAGQAKAFPAVGITCLLYTSPSPRDS